ncbi:MAG: DEAD/DEAH box helicase family protein [Candidatus Pacearchaeota archaeon]|nr:DEAD/DEAH box helicase family protein [Candidatus Pacearchaeota archaeon]
MEKPREYQIKIFEIAKNHNTLVVLPTGLGKTLIALMLAKERLKRYPNSKILFLAPTRPLTEQHYNYFRKYLTTYESHIFTGKINAKKRQELWKNAQIIFSTPQCIDNDLKNGLISLDEVSLLIEDEAHRCLKNYSYTFVAQEYSKQAKNPRLLGLTASPGSDASIIKEICKNLEIEAVEIRTRESEDVKPYLQKLDRQVIKVSLTEEMLQIRSLLQQIYEKKLEELKNRQLLFGRATKTNLLELQKKLLKMITTGNKHFNVLRGASVVAQAIKISYAIELLETQGIEQCYNYLQELFEQAKDKKSKAVQQIVNNKEIGTAYLLLTKLFNNRIEHPKFEKLKEIMLKEIEEKPQLKAIIFSQYRGTVNKISEMLTANNLKAKAFIGQAKRKTNGLTQIEQQAILREFSQGRINVLVSTSIGEEGLDLPEVDLVIFYEPIPSAIRKIQRQGRTARLKPGKLVILVTKNTRDESHYWAAYHKERKMHNILEDMQQKLNKEGKEKLQKKINDF